MKGLTLQDLSSYTIAFVVVAIFLGIGATILSTIQTTQYIDVNVANESINFAVNGTNYSTTYYPIQIINGIWDDAGHTSECYAIFSSRIPSNTTHITIISNASATNCSEGNLTTGIKYVDYNYQNQYTSAANATGQGLTGTLCPSGYLL